MTTYYVYFAPSQRASDGTNLFNKYSVIQDEEIDSAKKRLKNYFPNVKAYLTEDGDMKEKFGMEFIDPKYEFKLKQK